MTRIRNQYTRRLDHLESEVRRLTDALAERRTERDAARAERDEALAESRKRHNALLTEIAALRAAILAWYENGDGITTRSMLRAALDREV